MYDSITLGLPQLPPGVSMAEVVQDSEELELIAAAAADCVTPAQVTLTPRMALGSDGWAPCPERHGSMPLGCCLLALCERL